MYTAHINKSGNKQSVPEHSLGTAEKSKEYSGLINAENIGELQGLLHDMGKLCRDFDKYINKENDLKRGELDHSYAGAKYITQIADDMGGEYYTISRFIAHTIISHHGFHDWYDFDGNDYLKKRISNSANYNEMLSAVDAIKSRSEIEKIIIKANNEYTYIRSQINALCKNISEKEIKKQSRAFYLGLFERLMQSILIDADRTNTADFMSESSTEITHTHEEMEQIWNMTLKSLDEKLSKFADKNDAISMQRKSISERCMKFSGNNVGICRLIVPTGGGKTLSSLRFAINYCNSHSMEKIFYIAPFMSILEQNGSEISDIVGKENFIEHHSDALNEISTDEELEEYELRTEKWDLPVIATTMVQFLNALFSGKTSAVRRMHRLCKSVIIIDEVQSLPVKCVNMFNLAINFLSKICGCTIVLCSATQPVFENTEFPLITDENESMTGDHTKDFEVFKRTNIIHEIKPCGMTFEETAEFCHEKYEQAGNLLLIVDTKKAAKCIYDIMKDMNYSVKPEILHLSTNMCPEHRRAVIKKIRDNIDKPIICITTQLIEAGVDISFKCVVRSLAGLDNIAQAAGRCNRHGENPELCPVYVINIQEEDISKLHDIKRSQNISRMMISNEKYQNYTDTDTLSVFYRQLFREAENELSYNVKINRDSYTLLNFLSLNKKCHQNGFGDYDENNVYHAQAFRTAGDKFDVIDSDTVGIIVPYNEDAKNLISQLYSDILPVKAAEILRQAQKYTVSVYKNMFAMLNENNAVDETPCGALILKKENYNTECGIIMEGRSMDLLII